MRLRLRVWGTLVLACVLGCASGGEADPDGGNPGLPDAAGPRPDAPPGTPDGGGCMAIPACPVEFVYPSGDPTTVELRGNFSPDGWENGVPMTRDGDRFVATLDLPDDSSIQYKFVLDGTTWVPDPDNPNTVDDGFGGVNSVVNVDCDGCTAAGFDWGDAVMYFAMTDRFYDGDPTNNMPVGGVDPAANYAGGDLAGILAKLEEGYFSDLGINVLWLTAPVDNADGGYIGDDGYQYSGYHGYWPKDLETIDPRIGDETLLTQVVDTAHAMGIRVVLDYVMNHVHEESPVYTEHPDWFWPLNGCVCGDGCSWDPPEGVRCWFRSYLPDFNFQNAAARTWSVDNAIRWIQRTGVDGYRLDAIKHIEISWITDLRTRLKNEIQAPGEVFYLVGETFTGDKNLIKSYVNPSTMLDGQFDFPLRAEIARVILMRQGSMNDLHGFLDGNDGFYGPGAVMGTFIGNHDLPRSIHLAEDVPQFGEWDSGKARAWTNLPQLPGYRRPFERLLVANALLMTLPGVPLIYYGDEIGLPGGGDPDNRRMMQWTGTTADQEWLRARLGRLITIRHDHPALRHGTRTALSVSQDVYVYRMSKDDDTVIVALNRSDAAATASGVPDGSYRELLEDVAVSTPLTILPRSALILIAE